MGRFMINYWPSFLLSLVLLTGIVVSLRRFDFVMIEEMRAMISIMFGFATSCFLLSFIWLIQRKPRTDLDLDGDVPSMHPRGREDSENDSYDGGNNRISVISSDILDIPPAYEEALVSSKPINNWYKSQGTKAQVPHSSTCPCSSKDTSKWSQVTMSISDGCNCISSSSSKPRCTSGRNKSPTPQKLSVSSNHYSQYGSIEQISSPSELGSSSRKISYVQLDVDQLMMLSSSPPKYHELTFGQPIKRQDQNTTIDIS